MLGWRLEQHPGRCRCGERLLPPAGPCPALRLHGPAAPVPSRTGLCSVPARVPLSAPLPNCDSQLRAKGSAEPREENIFNSDFARFSAGVFLTPFSLSFLCSCRCCFPQDFWGRAIPDAAFWIQTGLVGCSSFEGFALSQGVLRRDRNRLFKAVCFELSWHIQARLFLCFLQKTIFKVLGQFLLLCFNRICSCECALKGFTAGLKCPLA